MLFPLMQTATQILTSPVLNHALLFVNKSSADFKEIYAAFNSAAEAFRLKVQTQTQIISNSIFSSIIFLWAIGEPHICMCMFI